MKKNYFLITLIFGIFFLFSQNIFAENLKVGTIERPPMAFKTESGKWTGLSIELLEEISKKAEFNYTLNEFDKFGDMIDSVDEKKNDLAIANITISSEREKKMDYSQPIFDSGLQLVVSKDGSKKSIFDVIIDSGILWFLLGALALLLVIAHVIWFFEKGTDAGRHDYFRDDYLGGIWDAFWWAFIIMTMGGFENEVPATKFSRFIAMIWIIISLFFVSSLTAQMTSSMTVAEMNSDISSYHDLDDKKVGVMKSDPIIKFVKNEIGVDPIVFEKYEDFYEALKDKKVDALIGDAPIVNYYVSKQGKSDFKIVGEIFKSEKYGILLQDDSPYKEKIDQVILELQENGRYKELYDKYFK